MPATKFICPNGRRITIKRCLVGCPQKERCMFLPTLRAVAESLDRGIKGATVTELISGVREAYLKKKTSYAVNPQDELYSLHGQAVHTIHENNTYGDILGEIRLQDKITSGKFDLYGKIIDEEEGVLGDLKVTSSYKLAKALGIYKVDVPTGEVYKTGARKGQPKTRKELRYDGLKHVWDWAVQLNYYRILLEQAGFTVKRMYIQAMCRDCNLRTAGERGITKSLYIIPINKISDRWLLRYFRKKASMLRTALRTRKLPPPCSIKETWQGKKCLDFCEVREKCPHATAMAELLQGGHAV